MNITLHLTAETEARLQAEAASTGKRPEELVLEALRDKFSTEPSSTATLTTEEWLRQFDAWVGGLESRNPHFDDSRESIYPDRE
jgi:hypothetical protein